MLYQFAFTAECSEPVKGQTREVRGVVTSCGTPPARSSVVTGQNPGHFLIKKKTGRTEKYAAKKRTCPGKRGHIVALSEFMCRVLFFYFFMGIGVAFLIPPPHTFVTHDETNQAKCNKSSNEQTETN